MNKIENKLYTFDDKTSDEVLFMNGFTHINQLIPYVNKLQQENQQLKEQIYYIRSGEYYSQLRFERDILQDLVDKGEISKEDKKFIDCTHRNTELLERIDKVIEKIKRIQDTAIKYGVNHNANICYDLIEILKGSESND